jgi:hypothetical protein
MDVTVSPDLAGRIGETAGQLASHLTSQAAGRLGESATCRTPRGRC